MSRIVTVACIAITLCLLCATGCSKKSPPAAPAAAAAQEKTKTAAEYKADAEKEIKQENANQELDKLEKSINEEASQEQQ